MHTWIRSHSNRNQFWIFWMKNYFLQKNVVDDDFGRSCARYSLMSLIEKRMYWVKWLKKRLCMLHGISHSYGIAQWFLSILRSAFSVASPWYTCCSEFPSKNIRFIHNDDFDEVWLTNCNEFNSKEQPDSINETVWSLGLISITDVEWNLSILGSWYLCMGWQLELEKEEID